MAFSIAISNFRTPIKSNPWLILFIVFFILVWVNSFLGTGDINN